MMQKSEHESLRPKPSVSSALQGAALLIALCAVCAFGVAAQSRATYTNPTLAGDYPDPSVIRVGQDYWATATSSEWAPEYPIMHSRDLVNWRVVGAVFQKRPAWSVGNYWAPEISEDRGRFYIYYTAKKKDGPLCVAVATARRPQGPYTDHGPLVCQEVGSIDGFSIRDENGQRYLLWKEDGNSKSVPTPIWAQRLSNAGTKLIGEKQELLRNDQAWEKHASLPYGDLIEGPAVVRRGGWFYMFYAGNFCCARECNYQVGVARSRKLMGPWEKNPANPILKGNDEFKCPGHGTIVSDARGGRDYMMYHAMDAKDFVYVGRQAMLDQIQWGANGWPSINEGRGPSNRAMSPMGARETKAEHHFFDDFTAPGLQPGWQWPQSNEPVMRIERVRGGRLILSPAMDQTTSPAGAIVAQTTTVGDYEATTLIDTRGMRRGALAGLSAYGDAENALGAVVDGRNIILWRREKNEQKLVATVADVVTSSLVHLRMTASDGRKYQFAFSTDGNRWQNLGEEMDGEYLPPWDRGVRVALTAGGAAGASGKFEWLRIAPTRKRTAKGE